MLKLGVLLALAAIECFSEKAKLAGLLYNLPRHESRRDSGHSEGVATPTKAPTQLTRVPSIPPPPAIDAAYAVRPTSAERRATLPNPCLNVSLDAPLTPLVVSLPVKVQCAPLMKRTTLPASGEKVTPVVSEEIQATAHWVHRAEMGLAAMLLKDVVSGDCWMMAIPAVLFAVENNVLCVAILPPRSVLHSR